MRQEFEIRPARVDDAPRISALILKLAPFFASVPGASVAPWFAETITPTAIAGYISDSRFNYLVALVNGVLAGVVAVREATYVHHLFVALEYQRRGVAARLWWRAELDALAAGNRDGFYVRSSEYAIPVYESFGFRVVGERTEKAGIVFVPMRLETHRVHTAKD